MTDQTSQDEAPDDHGTSPTPAYVVQFLAWMSGLVGLTVGAVLLLRRLFRRR